MLEHFTPDAARALGGPDWLVDRRARGGRAARRRRVADRRPRRSGATAGSTSSTSTGTGRCRPSSSGEPGDEPAPGGGPVAAEAGERAGLVVVRNGRVVHHELDADARGEGRAGLRPRHLRAPTTSAASLGACSDASPDAFTVLHDAFLAGGAFVQVPAGVVVEQADRRAALVGGRRPRQLPAHARRRRGAAPRSRCSTASAPPTPAPAAPGTSSTRSSS